jgi:hypothetical protein
MANRFDVVPVRTNDKSGIVVRVVLRAQTRRTIVFTPGLESRAVEVFDLPAILGREGQVEMRRLLLHAADAQRGLTVRAAKLDTQWPLRDNGYAERLECLKEKLPGRCIVANPENDVIKHKVSKIV